MENLHQTNLDFIKKLFLRLAFDEAYTLEQIQKMDANEEIEASRFFIYFDHTKLTSVDYIVMNEDDMLERKDNPIFEYDYKIFLFYNSLLPNEREAFYNDYVRKYQYYDFDASFDFNPENHKIPDPLLNYCVRNSKIFFDEFDLSTGMLEVEYFLMKVDHYSKHFSVDSNAFVCFEDDETYS